MGAWFVTSATSATDTTSTLCTRMMERAQRKSICRRLSGRQVDANTKEHEFNKHGLPEWLIANTSVKRVLTNLHTLWRSWRLALRYPQDPQPHKSSVCIFGSKRDILHNLRNNCTSWSADNEKSKGYIWIFDKMLLTMFWSRQGMSASLSTHISCSLSWVHSNATLSSRCMTVLSTECAAPRDTIAWMTAKQLPSKKQLTFFLFGWYCWAAY